MPLFFGQITSLDWEGNGECSIEFPKENYEKKKNSPIFGKYDSPKHINHESLHSRYNFYALNVTKNQQPSFLQSSSILPFNSGALRVSPPQEQVPPLLARYVFEDVLPGDSIAVRVEEDPLEIKEMRRESSSSPRSHNDWSQQLSETDVVPRLSAIGVTLKSKDRVKER